MYESIMNFITNNIIEIAVGILCFFIGVFITAAFKLIKGVSVKWIEATREKREYLRKKRYQKKVSKRLLSLKVPTFNLREHNHNYVEVRLCFENKSKISKWEAYKIEKYIDKDFKYCKKTLGGWFPETTSVNDIFTLVIIKEQWSFLFIRFSFFVGWIYLTDRDSRIFRYVNESFQDIAKKKAILVWYFYLRPKYQQDWNIIREALLYIEKDKDTVWVKTFPEENALICVLTDCGYSACGKNEKTADNVSTWRKDIHNTLITELGSTET